MKHLKATKPYATTKEFFLKSYRRIAIIFTSCFFGGSFSEFNALNCKVMKFFLYI